MEDLFGSGSDLKLNIESLKKTLVSNMLRVHIASIDKRMESCQRCPLVCENPSGFKAEPAIDPKEKSRLDNYPNIPKGTKLPYYEGLRKRLKENTDALEDVTKTLRKPVRKPDRTLPDGANREILEVEARHSALRLQFADFKKHAEMKYTARDQEITPAGSEPVEANAASRRKATRRREGRNC